MIHFLKPTPRRWQRYNLKEQQPKKISLAFFGGLLAKAA
jgi:hypothetical protein